MAHTEDRRGTYRVLVWTPEGKRPLGRPRHGWECNIKMDLQEVGGEGGPWPGGIWLRIGTPGSCSWYSYFHSYSIS